MPAKPWLRPTGKQQFGLPAFAPGRCAIPAASDVSHEVPTSPLIFQVGSLGPAEGARCSVGPAPTLRSLQRLTPAPLHICSVLRAGELRESRGFLAAWGFLCLSAVPKQAPASRGDWPGLPVQELSGCRHAAMQSHQPGSHPSWLPPLPLAGIWAEATNAAASPPPALLHARHRNSSLGQVTRQGERWCGIRAAWWWVPEQAAGSPTQEGCQAAPVAWDQHSFCCVPRHGQWVSAPLEPSPAWMLPPLGPVLPSTPPQPFEGEYPKGRTSTDSTGSYTQPKGL